MSEDLPGICPIDSGRLNGLNRLTLQGCHKHNEHEGRPLPNIPNQNGSPYTPGIIDPGKIYETERLPDGGKGTFARIRKHAEHIGNADWRNHHRQQEYHPKEPSSRQTLDSEH